jgi:uncharacterized membrane protein YeaQ/YmgE (transglycosylase-associated protein family)
MLTTMLFVLGLAAMEKALLLMAAIYLGVTGAVGIYEAWVKKRGAAGWIVNIVVSVIGGTIGGFALGGAAMAPAEALGRQLGPNWAELDASLGLVATIIGLVAGSWIALRIVNRFR